MEEGGIEQENSYFDREWKEEDVVFCNDLGCWIDAVDSVCDEFEVDIPQEWKTQLYGEEQTKEIVEAATKEIEKPKKKPTTAKKAPIGIFAPGVLAAKQVLGDKELNKLRAEVIALHSKVITKFVDTSDSQFGRIVLKRMFEAADKDGDGQLTPQEVRDALNALGFKWI